MEAYERKVLQEAAVKLREAKDKLDLLFNNQYGDDESLKLPIGDYIDQKDEARAYVLAYATGLLITVEVYAKDPEDEQAA
jgi:hypothetical protein